MDAHSAGYYFGLVFGALAMGFFCGLVPVVTGALTQQKKLAHFGFITCIVASLIAGIVVALPVAVGFGIVILVKWFRRPEPPKAQPPEERVDA
jgi:hypothetical protein